MSNPYQLVVFDWEGTISDTLGPVLQIVTEEAQHLGFGEIDPQQARKYVDLGLTAALKKLLPDLTPTDYDKLFRSVQETMVTKPAEVYLIPGVLGFIKQLQADKVSLAIATNKGHQSLMRALQASGLDAFFKVTRSAGQVPAKPCPQMLEEIMDEFGEVAATTLMIGDSTTDMEMANSIGVTAIGVDFYHEQESVLKQAGAVAVFDDYALLAKYLARQQEQ